MKKTGGARSLRWCLYTSVFALGTGHAVLAAETSLSHGAPAAAGQQALGVQVDARGVFARVCAAGACAGEGGASIAVPAEVRAKLGKARARTIQLQGGRHVIRVEIPGESDSGTWVLLIAAPPSGKGTEPLILFNDFTGLAKGEHGEGRAKVIFEERADDQKPEDQSVRLLIGDARDDVNICGRPTLVSPRALDPQTLTFASSKQVSLQNLPKADRDKALKIKASRVESPAAPESIRLLRATAASSAVDKQFATLTDGDRESVWAENKSDLGRGEFVSMSSSSDVGIRSIELALPAESEDTVPPKSLYLATADQLIEIAIPEDANRKKGGVYEAALPSELRTSCITLILEGADGPRGTKNAKVSVGEVTARSALSGLSMEALSGALAGGDTRAKAAAALLARGGKAAVKAVIDTYPKLDSDGQHLALDVIESAPCADHLPFFVGLLNNMDATSRAKELSRGKPEPEIAHALDRIRRCGRAAAPALTALMEDANGRPYTKVLAANELALLSPGDAVPVLLKAIGDSNDAARREFRRALSSAAKSERAKTALSDALTPEAFQGLSEVVRIDLLRAIGPRLSAVEGSAQAFSSLATANAPFRTRYLLQVPAAELARAGDASGLAYLQASLRSDADPHVRARAAEAAARVPAMISDLQKAVDDPEVRVRESAVQAIAQAMSEGAQASPALSAVLAKRLSLDSWTMVRAGTASALGALPATPEADRALSGALSDLSPEVRGRALDALGAHKAKPYAEKIRGRQDDPEEQIEVRARATLALASMCDTRSMEDWTKYAHRSIKPMDERERRMGSAAIAALGIVHPSDLKQRLAPLLSKDAMPVVREMAKAALSAEGACK